MKKMIFGLALVAGMAGCAGTTGSRESAADMQVSDADMGRLAPGQMGPVDQARQFQASARDEQARAKLRLDQAERLVAVAQADQQAVKADEDRAEAQSKIANANREPAQLEKARQMKEAATLHRSTAEAHIDYVNKLVEARKGSMEAADKQVALGDARLEWSKVQALRDANVPAYTKYDQAKFQNQVTSTQKSFDEALQKARTLDAQAASSQRRYEDLDRQMQARGTAVQTG